MQGPELGVHADDIEPPDIEQEPKQEILENKDVRSVLNDTKFSLGCIYLDTSLCVIDLNMFFVSLRS